MVVKPEPERIYAPDDTSILPSDFNYVVSHHGGMADVVTAICSTTSVLRHTASAFTFFVALLMVVVKIYE